MLPEDSHKKAKKVRKVKVKTISKIEEELKASLFHIQCICQLCRRYDESKETGEEKKASPLAPIPPTKSKVLMEKPAAKIEKKADKSKVSPLKTSPVKPMKSIKSNNIYSVLKLDDPGNGQQGSSVTTRNHGSRKRGGAKPKAITQYGDIFESAIKVAESHGIKVIPDKPNAAQGDCLFDSIRDNVNHRPDNFPDKLNDSVESYRELWVTELEERYKSTEAYPGFHGRNMTDEEKGEWAAAWTQQKNPREYNVDLYNVSDLTPEGLGHCINKHILVFSTDPVDPVKVFWANRFDKDVVPTTDVPVVIAYDHRGPGHYESLLPKGKLDVRKCTTLVKSIQDGIYDKHNPNDYLRKAQLAKKAEAKKHQRSDEMPEAKRARLEKMKVNNAESRSEETPEAKKARLEKKKVNTAESRSEETAEAKRQGWKR